MTKRGARLVRLDETAGRSGRAAAVQEVVVELDRRVGHLEPSDVDPMEQVVGEWRNFATIDNKIIHLVPAEALDGRAQHLRILDVPAVGDHLDIVRVIVVVVAVWPTKQGVKEGRAFLVIEI